MTDTPLAPAVLDRADRSDDQGRSPAALIQAAAYGDVAAFEQLVRALQPQVFRWALTFARDVDDADEITQDTFVRVHRNLGQFRGESALEAWVYGITRRVALQRKRKSDRRKWLSESVIPGLDNVYNTDPGGRVDRQRIAGYIRHFFTELPPRQREVFDLVDLQGHEPAEVAEMLGLKQATLRANLFKARASIRANLIAAHPAAGEIDR
jgi:RNA polymerase sigma-70 factor (ECF subfamily)